MKIEEQGNNREFASSAGENHLKTTKDLSLVQKYGKESYSN